VRLSPNDRTAIVDKVRGYYGERMALHGPVARGVDWKSEESQELRFKQLLEIVPEGRRFFSLNDYGCGYGALRQYLCARGYACAYRGFDVSSPSLAAARAANPDADSAAFVDDEARLAPAQYTVASGIFNVKLDVDVEEWHEYMLETIERLAAMSLEAFAFNVLSTSSEPARRRPDLYYADPLVLFRFCQEQLSPHVALLHDYGLFEFTVIVRLSRPSPTREAGFSSIA
jgi:SAM-dependent methyltransferase